MLKSNESFYDSFTGNVPVYEKSDTPFQNREDMTKPYQSDLTSKADNAPTEQIKTTGANNEWMKFICNRNSPDFIASKLNLKFNRNSITGDNFESEKAKYISTYKEAELKIIKGQQ